MSSTEPVDQHSARLQQLSADITAAASAARESSDPEAAARLVHTMTVQLHAAAVQTLDRVAAEFTTMTGYDPAPAAADTR
ncbi:hypothetical protein [Nocardia sp. NPDC051750]|uniref:hypothetical protein n=1 Tax=Nocardia sp. NPDC051750 TaxID=3364325 RepID=UPI00379E35EC